MAKPKIRRPKLARIDGRKSVRALSAQARSGDPHATMALLRHNLSYGHRRLSLRRYFLALALRADGVEQFHESCRRLATTLPEDELRKMARDAAALAQRAQPGTGSR